MGVGAVGEDSELDDDMEETEEMEEREDSEEKEEAEFSEEMERGWEERSLVMDAAMRLTSRDSIVVPGGRTLGCVRSETML
jgi:hypothetical protein